MASDIDPTKPAQGVPALKSDMRANWQAAHDEIEALQATTGSAGVYGTATVAEWLTGGAYSQGYANLAEMRTATGIADLELNDTIDWVNIQTALNEHGTCYLPVGTARITRPVSITSDATIIGKGARLSKIEPTVGSTHDGIVANSSYRLHFEDFTVDNALNNINVAGMLHTSRLIGLWLTSPLQSSLKITGSIYASLIESCRFAGGQRGIDIVGNTLTNGACIQSCRASDTSERAISIENTSTQAQSQLTMISNITEGNSGVGLYLNGVSTTIVGHWFESNGRDVDVADLELHNSHSSVVQWITMSGLEFSSAGGSQTGDKGIMAFDGGIRLNVTAPIGRTVDMQNNNSASRGYFFGFISSPVVNYLNATFIPPLE